MLITQVTCLRDGESGLWQVFIHGDGDDVCIDFEHRDDAQSMVDTLNKAARFFVLSDD